MSKKDYPKMLYQGNLQVYKTAIAENEDHESELKDQDWIEYGDLKEPKTESEGVAIGVGVSALNGLDDVKQELVDVTQERDELRTENERLNNIITKGSAENIELKENLSKSDSAHDKFRNDVAAMKARIDELQGMDSVKAGDSKDAVSPVDNSKLTMDQLRKKLDEKKIEYKARDDKDTLLGLLNGHSN
ncbi:hypothetical protein ACDI99_10145 [Acinetobacter radioresistens]|uniref:hypothetical protein n=1 Tax=Acinetobacter radioresistens TaxID=40216 RepID=UPI00355857B7